MYKVKVNNKYNFDIDAKNGQIKLNNQLVMVDDVILNQATTHVLYKNKSYTIEVVEFNSAEKIAIVKVNGTVYTLTIKDELDELLKQLGMDNLLSSKIKLIKAPMPGLVLNVLVASGDEVKKGDNLLVLEAMKMENMIKSPIDGIIKKVEIKQGDKVEKNTLLIHFT